MDINKTARGKVPSATAGANSNQMSETLLNEVNTQHGLQSPVLIYEPGFFLKAVCCMTRIFLSGLKT